MTKGALDFLMAISGPKRPEDKIVSLAEREPGQAVDTAMLPNPIARLDVVGMRILRKAGRLGLLGGEKALLPLRHFKEPSQRVEARSSHNTILQLFCSIVQMHFEGRH